jgi:hypothetical protein
MPAPDREGFRIENGESEVRLFGIIDEHADLSALDALPARRVVLNLRGIRRINSFGVRLWMDQIKKVSARVPLEFVEVPPPIVDQANMLEGFLGRGKVISFYVPYACETCDQYVERLVTAADCVRGGLPEVRCATCSSVLEVDDVEEQYLQILRIT